MKIQFAAVVGRWETSVKAGQFSLEETGIYEANNAKRSG
jgi:hypothetical protein